MGSPDKLAARAAAERLNARERIDALLDPGTFEEIGTLVGSGSRPPVAADGFVAGSGRVEGRPVLVGAEDFTTLGGSIGIGGHAKRVRLARLAMREMIPLVLLLEGAGERVTNAFERYPYAPNDLQILARLSGLVPTVAAVMGASAGHGALAALLLDFLVMVEGGAIFSAGPPLVALATGEQVTKEDLGGVEVHTGTSGVAHNPVADDRTALALVRRYLSYFPTNAHLSPPVTSDGEVGKRRLDGIIDIIPTNPRRGYDIRTVIEMLADAASVLEVQPLFGASIVTALARLGGAPLAIVANQPLVDAGAITRDAGDKTARFIELADAFHLPILFLADNPGVMAGPAAERSGALRSAARMFAAQARVRGPKLHVTLRKAYGFGSSLMAMNPFDDQTVTLALPTATLGAMPAAGGGSAAHFNPETQEALHAAEVGGPWRAADTLAFDEIIDPRELRNALLDALALTRHRPPAGPRPGGIRP